MPRDFFDPPWEKTNIVLVDSQLLQRAQGMILGCEQCADKRDAEIPFDWILDRVTGSDPKVTDYVLAAPAKCPRCTGVITEKTLVEPDEGF